MRVMGSGFARVGALIFIVSILLALSSGQTSAVDTKAAELRARFEARYREGHISAGPHGTDVTAIVAPYIPPGTSFDEAEKLLRDAGFEIEPHPPKIQPPERKSFDWYGLLAQISPFHTQFPFRFDLYVTLMPKGPGDYSTVQSVKATMWASGP
jgi:hypothetical protein